MARIFNLNLINVIRDRPNVESLKHEVSDRGSEKTDRVFEKIDRGSEKTDKRTSTSYKQV